MARIRTKEDILPKWLWAIEQFPNHVVQKYIESFTLINAIEAGPSPDSPAPRTWSIMSRTPSS
jgi:hypothetical protein